MTGLLDRPKVRYLSINTVVTFPIFTPLLFPAVHVWAVRAVGRDMLIPKYLHVLSLTTRASGEGIGS